MIRTVDGRDSGVLHRIATEILEPLYGSQTKALSEWLSGSGFKRVFVPLNVEDVALGLLSLKARPDRPYLKISTLLVLPEFQGRGYG